MEIKEAGKKLVQFNPAEGLDSFALALTIEVGRPKRSNLYFRMEHSPTAAYPNQLALHRSGEAGLGEPITECRMPDNRTSKWRIAAIVIEHHRGALAPSASACCSRMHLACCRMRLESRHVMAQAVQFARLSGEKWKVAFVPSNQRGWLGEI
jgi:hypothetical protein